MQLDPVDDARNEKATHARCNTRRVTNGQHITGRQAGREGGREGGTLAPSLTLPSPPRYSAANEATDHEPMIVC